MLYFYQLCCHSIGATDLFGAKPKTPQLNRSVGATDLFGAKPKTPQLNLSVGAKDLFGAKPKTPRLNHSVGATDLFGAKPKTPQLIRSVGATDLFGAKPKTPQLNCSPISSKQTNLKHNHTYSRYTGVPRYLGIPVRYRCIYEYQYGTALRGHHTSFFLI